jgi:hypothetical protein
MAKDKPAPEALEGEALPEKRTPEEWSAELFPRTPRGRFHADAWKHSAAAALHGWTLHAHHTGTPLLLSLSDYQAALTAAMTLIGHSYQPHAAALSPHAGKA